MAEVFFVGKLANRTVKEEDAEFFVFVFVFF
jgi:hypothetical protein